MTLGITVFSLPAKVFVLYLKAPGTEAGRADRRGQGEGANFAAICALSAGSDTEQLHTFLPSFTHS